MSVAKVKQSSRTWKPSSKFKRMLEGSDPFSNQIIPFTCKDCKFSSCSVKSYFQHVLHDHFEEKSKSPAAVDNVVNVSPIKLRKFSYKTSESGNALGSPLQTVTSILSSTTCSSPIDNLKSVTKSSTSRSSSSKAKKHQEFTKMKLCEVFVCGSANTSPCTFSESNTIVLSNCNSPSSTCYSTVTTSHHENTAASVASASITTTLGVVKTVSSLHPDDSSHAANSGNLNDNVIKVESDAISFSNISTSCIKDISSLKESVLDDRILLEDNDGVSSSHSTPPEKLTSSPPPRKHRKTCLVSTATDQSKSHSSLTCITPTYANPSSLKSNDAVQKNATSLKLTDANSQIVPFNNVASSFVAQVEPPMKTLLHSGLVSLPQFDQLSSDEQMFSDETMEVLERSFFSFPYPPTQRQRLLAEKTKLSIQEVKMWFAMTRVKHGISWEPDEVHDAWSYLRDFESV